MPEILRAENISKMYRLGQVGTGTLSHDLNRWWHKVRGKPDPYMMVGAENDRESNESKGYVWSLQDINFSIEQGEILGIIGRNGAGKSTLLKLISKVTAPTKGTIKINGRVASLLEVGTGFHPELTGRDNIFLNGAILGMSKSEIKSKFDEIVDFSGVSRYVDTPVKRYSSGMYVRLAFAVAAHLEPELLVVDEVLAVGDAEFQRKCIGKIKDVSGEGRTVIFVSHNMGVIKNLCNTGIFLRNGKLMYNGDIDNTISKYLMHGKEDLSDYMNPESPDKNHIKSVRVTNSGGEKSNSFISTDEICLHITLDIKEAEEDLEIGFSLWSMRGIKLFYDHTNIKQTGVNEFVVRLPQNLLVSGEYYMNVALHVPRKRLDHAIKETCFFEVTETGSQLAKYTNPDMGVIKTNFDWDKL